MIAVKAEFLGQDVIDAEGKTGRVIAVAIDNGIFKLLVMTEGRLAQWLAHGVALR